MGNSYKINKPHCRRTNRKGLLPPHMEVISQNLVHTTAINITPVLETKLQLEKILRNNGDDFPQATSFQFPSKSLEIVSLNIYKYSISK